MDKELTIILTTTEVKEIIQLLQYYVKLVGLFKHTNSNIDKDIDSTLLEDVFFSSKEKATIKSLKDKIINNLSMNDVKYSNLKVIEK